MLRKISNLNIKDDPIRPELELWWRLIKGREVYGFFEKALKCKAVVCIAKMIDVPKILTNLETLLEPVELWLPTLYGVMKKDMVQS